MAYTTPAFSRRINTGAGLPLAADGFLSMAYRMRAPRMFDDSLSSKGSGYFPGAGEIEIFAAASGVAAGFTGVSLGL